MSSADVQRFGRLGKLSPGEEAILRLLVEHGIVVKSSWDSIADSSLTVEGLSNAMWSLTRRRLAVARPLHPGRMYFMLSKSSVHKLGLPEQRSAPLTGTTKLRAYARLVFHTRIEPTTFRLSKPQVELRLGTAVGGMPTGFFGRTGKPEHLGFLRIDGNPHGPPKHAAQSIRHDVLRVAGVDALRQKIKQKHFEWVWITVTQARADAVRAMFAQYDVGKAPVTTLAVSELLPLILPKGVTDPINRIFM